MKREMWHQQSSESACVYNRGGMVEWMILCLIWVILYHLLTGRSYVQVFVHINMCPVLLNPVYVCLLNKKNRNGIPKKKWNKFLGKLEIGNEYLQDSYWFYKLGCCIFFGFWIGFST